MDRYITLIKGRELKKDVTKVRIMKDGRLIHDVQETDIDDETIYKAMHLADVDGRLRIIVMEEATDAETLAHKVRDTYLDQYLICSNGCTCLKVTDIGGSEDGRSITFTVTRMMNDENGVRLDREWKMTCLADYFDETGRFRDDVYKVTDRETWMEMARKAKETFEEI